MKNILTNYQITHFPSARYYNSALSLWLSVDPLVDKYPNLSPYTYCAGNPVGLVDPDGETIVIGEYIYNPNADMPDGLTYSQRTAWKSLGHINKNTIGGKVVKSLVQSSLTYVINTDVQESNYTAKEHPNGGNGGTINIAHSPISMDETLSHELFHAYQDEMGQYGETVHNEVEAYMFEAICNNQPGYLNIKENVWNKEYSDAVMQFKDFNITTATEGEFNNMFNTLLNGFLRYSKANAAGLYDKCKTDAPKSNLLRNLIFE